MRYRIYYNRTDDHPISWCFDQGTIGSQVRIGAVVLNKISGTFLAQPPKPKLPPNEPYGWLEVDCKQVTINQGVACFES